MTTLRGMVAALVVASAVHTQPAPLAIRNVTVVDVTNGALRANQTVLVEGNRIRAVGPIRQVDIPSGTAIVDGAGKFLIPGLWDMHVHTPSDAEARTVHLPLMIANGITGARVMWGRSFNLAQRGEIESGRLLGPRMVISTPIFDGRMWKGSIEPTSPDDARRTVRSFAAEGYDFVKTYQFLPRDVYLAIADEAKRLRIPLTGHVPLAVSLAEALDAGQRSVEHGVGLGLACSRDESRLRAEFTAAAAKLPAYSFAEHGTIMLDAEAQPLAAFDAAKCAAAAARIRNTGTWIVPTLTLYRGLGAAPGSPVRNDPRLQRLPEAMRKRFASSPPSPGAEALRTEMGRLTRTMLRAGVGVLAGTDTPNPYVLPGFGLHDELALLVEAGLTPLQALQAATLNPARFLNRADSLGAIAAGKLADLVLLDANPLDDIRNTQRINALIVDGRLLRRDEIDALLTSVVQPSALPSQSRGE